MVDLDVSTLSEMVQRRCFFLTEGSQKLSQTDAMKVRCVNILKFVVAPLTIYANPFDPYLGYNG